MTIRCGAAVQETAALIVIHSPPPNRAGRSTVSIASCLSPVVRGLMSENARALLIKNNTAIADCHHEAFDATET